MLKLLFLLFMLLIFLFIKPKGFDCKGKGNLGINDILLKLVLSVFSLLFFIALNFSSFLFCSNFDFDPNESSLIFDWSFRHILLSNNCSLKLGSELSLDIFDPI